jgi:hypothetical protein
MKTFFFVDRYGTCIENTEMRLRAPSYGFPHWTSENRETPTEIAATLLEFFPRGLSLHGERYFFERNQNAQGQFIIEHLIELVVELVRRSDFSDRPSRMESFFGCESMESALNFRNRFGKPWQRIFRVETFASFRADMNLLSLGASNASAANLARKYWSGSSSESPFWEVLMASPIKVLDEVRPDAQ